MMSRGLEIERDDRREIPEAREKPPEAVERDQRDPRERSRTLPSREFSLPHGPDRETVWTRQRPYEIRGSESNVLVVAGTFRVVFERDLADRDSGDSARLSEDLRHLERHGLVLRRDVPSDDAGHRECVVCLTKEGRALLQAHRGDEPRIRGQAVHGGWQKPREVVHDASLFRMYQIEAARIERQGGHADRVILGEDLKRKYLHIVNDDVAHGHIDHDRTKAAAACHLPMVNGHVEIPDVRVEYTTAAGTKGRVDLELVTDAYHAGQIAAKRAAGFTLYSAGGGNGMHALGEPGPRAGASSPDFISSLLTI
jgi:DNA-binding MarR family transcriptional regulator